MLSILLLEERRFKKPFFIKGFVNKFTYILLIWFINSLILQSSFKLVLPATLYSLFWMFRVAVLQFIFYKFLIFNIIFTKANCCRPKVWLTSVSRESVLSDQWIRTLLRGALILDLWLEKQILTNMQTKVVS